MYIKRKELEKFRCFKGPLIDVRSPSEYYKGHMPNSINIPLFDNDERSIIGTIYKKEGRKKAVIEGLKFFEKKLESRTKIVSAVIRSLKLPPRFRLKLVKEDPVRLELSLTPSYGKNPIIVGLVESLDLVARRDREGRLPRDLQGTWDWTVRHGKVSTGGWNPMLKEALQTMFDTGLPAIVYEELTGDDYRPVDGFRHIK